MSQSRTATFSCPYWESEILFAKVVAANQGVLRYTKVWSFVAPDSDDPPFTQVRLSRKFMETQLRAIYPSVCAHWHTAVVMARHYQDAQTTEGQLLSDQTFPQSFFSEHSCASRIPLHASPIVVSMVTISLARLRTRTLIRQVVYFEWYTCTCQYISSSHKNNGTVGSFGMRTWRDL